MVSFSFSFYKICFRKQWGIKYVILLQDSDIGGPSSITVRMEYLFAFSETGQKVSFLFFFPGVTEGNEDARLVQPLASLEEASRLIPDQTRGS